MCSIDVSTAPLQVRHDQITILDRLKMSKIFLMCFGYYGCLLFCTGGSFSISASPEILLPDSDANLMSRAYAFLTLLWLAIFFFCQQNLGGDTLRWLWHLLFKVTVASWQQYISQKPQLPYVLLPYPSPPSPWLALL